MTTQKKITPKQPNEKKEEKKLLTLPEQFNQMQKEYPELANYLAKLEAENGKLKDTITALRVILEK